MVLLICFSEEQSKLDEQKKWLDQELERALEQRKQMEELQKVRGHPEVNKTYGQDAHLLWIFVGVVQARRHCG